MQYYIFMSIIMYLRCKYNYVTLIASVFITIYITQQTRVLISVAMFVNRKQSLSLTAK